MPNERMNEVELVERQGAASLQPPAATGPAAWLTTLRHLLAGMRPHQWVKNGFLFAPLVFSHELGDPLLLLRASIAFLFFSLIASAVYLGNDILDVEADRLHPVKKHRPIASGRLPLPLASAAAAVLAAAALAGGLTIGWGFAAVLATYLAFNVAYSWGLKKIAFLDVGVIATGFVLRVLAGALAIDKTPSAWIFVCTFALALYLGFGKRKHEILAAQGAGSDPATTRAALGGYTLPRLDLALTVAGALALIGYLLYSLAPGTIERFGYVFLLTLPFPAFGIWRFHRLLIRSNRASSPTEALLTDLPFVLNLAAWLMTVIAVVYLL